MSNKDLNRMGHWKNERCIYCDRCYPETILNIEGHIHHKKEFQCVDLKGCRRAKRKLDRKRGKP